MEITKNVLTAETNFDQTYSDVCAERTFVHSGEKQRVITRLFLILFSLTNLKVYVRVGEI